jgi:hypothetical protein
VEEFLKKQILEETDKNKIVIFNSNEIPGCNRKKLEMKYRSCALDTIYLDIHFAKKSEECSRDTASNCAATVRYIIFNWKFIFSMSQPGTS